MQITRSHRSVSTHTWNPCQTWPFEGSGTNLIEASCSWRLDLGRIQFCGACTVLMRDPFDASDVKQHAVAVAPI